MKRLLGALACAAALFTLAPPAAAPAAPAVSVMHGFADMGAMTLWAQTRASTRLAVEFFPEGRETALRRVEAMTDAAHDFVAHLRLANLEPGTAYRYRVLADGKPVREGAFRTQPLWQFRAGPPDFAVAFGSCAYLNDPYSRPGRPWGEGFQVFDAIAAKSPDFMLWLGDNVYFREPEWTSPEGMSARYRAYREAPELARLWTATSHIAIWDDHDYGPNDSDASFVGKGWALDTFRRYWPNPTAGLPGVPGIFTQVSFGDVDFFLLDDRFHRYPNRYPDVPAKTMWGAAQLEWLKQALLTSRATFKVVANGSQFWNRASRFEGLYQFPADQKALADWLAAERIPGVVFLSGDRHFASLLRIERPGTYPLYEFTASPLTAGLANPSREERENPDLVPGTFTLARNFGMLRFTGPREARRLAFELYDSDGKMLWQRSVGAGELRPPAAK
ncbi:MAG: alkaline phosphatase D family protein [Burkholderiales bacterium]|nr:alkaline phosphatase D family protein [Burkholderiales bacterium]